MFSLLTLLDDIGSALDDVAVMTKKAVHKTSVLMSDDLAVNADVLQGTSAARELPVIWKIFLGSLVNKVIAISSVIGISLAYPPLINYILLVGGLYLSYEGAHKVVFYFKGHEEESHGQGQEKEKIKGAIKTDLVLSVEIVVIAKSGMLGTLAEQIAALSIVGLIASVLIYGLVAIIVKTDDAGLLLIKNGHIKSGKFLVDLMPKIMKSLTVIGTVAMFLVGGGIVSHFFHLPIISLETIDNLFIGIITGLVTLMPVTLIQKFFK